MDSPPPTTQDTDATSSFETFAASRRGKAKRWLFALKAAASAALIFYVLSGADLGAVWSALRGVDPRWLIPAVAAQFIGPALITTRWKGLLRAQGIAPGWVYLYRSTLISGFFRQFMPSTIGGDVIRGYDAWRAGASKGLAFMSLLIDRLMGLMALVILAMTALLFFPDVAAKLPGARLWGAVALAALIALVVLLVRPHRTPAAPGTGAEASPDAEVGGGKLQKIAAGLALYRGHRGALVRALGLSFLLQINVVSFYWCLSQALGLPIGYWDFYIIAPVAILVMMLPISINGIGVRESIFVFLLTQWGVGAAEGVALAWLEYGLFLVMGLLGGALFALRRR
jgi:uncharacterized membrane protein YbhN (UPF0104 family)